MTTRFQYENLNVHPNIHLDLLAPFLITKLRRKDPLVPYWKNYPQLIQHYCKYQWYPAAFKYTHNKALCSVWKAAFYLKLRYIVYTKWIHTKQQ